MSRASIHKSIKDKVKRRYDYHCAYCGCEPTKLQVDHIIPVVMGGTDDIENLIPSCAPCNNYKSSWTIEQFRTNLELQVERARKQSVNFRLAERFGLIEVINKPIKFYFELNKPQP
jgi:5-methylcytosine-specific restriction endonuclease McrA